MSSAFRSRAAWLALLLVGLSPAVRPACGDEVGGMAWFFNSASVDLPAVMLGVYHTSPLPETGELNAHAMAGWIPYGEDVGGLEFEAEMTARWHRSATWVGAGLRAGSIADAGVDLGPLLALGGSYPVSDRPVLLYGTLGLVPIDVVNSYDGENLSIELGLRMDARGYRWTLAFRGKDYYQLNETIDYLGLLFTVSREL